MAVSEKTGLRNIYFCITVDGQKHEIPAENARQANSIAEAKYGYAKIAVAPQESLVKKATDLEPIPVEDVWTNPDQERCPACKQVLAPDQLGVLRCYNRGCDEYGLTAQVPQPIDKKRAKDSSRKARLHRALDAVMDSVK